MRLNSPVCRLFLILGIVVIGLAVTSSLAIYFLFQQMITDKYQVVRGASLDDIDGRFFSAMVIIGGVNAIVLTIATAIGFFSFRSIHGKATNAILANTPVGIAIFDTDRTIRRVNRQYCAIYAMDENQLVGQKARILYRSQEQSDDIGRRAYPMMLAGGTFDEDVPMRRNDGRELWIHLTGRLVDAADPAAGVVWAIQDISARKEAEARIHRLTNLLAALSQCNQAIVHCKSEEELFPEICRAAVHHGGMKTAWIGLADTENNRIVPVCIYGDGTGFVEQLPLTADEGDPYGWGPSARTIRENRPCWVQDFHQDPATAAWREHGRQAEWAAAASLPLHRNGIPIGCLTLYSGTVNAFDDDARALLVEMAADISFALDTFVREADRRRAAEELRVAATAFESQESMVITDAENVIQRVNGAFVSTTGYSPEEAIGRKLDLLQSNRRDAEPYAAIWARVKRDGSWQGEVWNRCKDGTELPAWLNINAVKGEANAMTHTVAAFTDTTQIKASEEEIKHLAFYDQLTGLPNRRLLIDRLRQTLAASARSKREGALFFIDLDNFKTSNDTLGHDKGDLLLQLVAKRLSNYMREGDTVARLGGDEFVVILQDLSESTADAAVQAELVGGKILAMLGQPFDLGSCECYCTASIGVTLFADRQDSWDEVLKQADLAMYRAKAQGRNALRFFDPEMQASIIARAALEADLRTALRQNALFLCYQPQVDGKGKVSGAEALVRWRHPERGLIMPNDFITVAEETGLILPLGHWVLETACAQLVAWAAKPKTAHLSLAVNVSVRQFRQPGFVEQVVSVLDETRANPRKLKLEMTETLVLDDVEDIIAKMTALKALGVEFALDDFGTGYSSLSCLKRLPLSQVKIDRSFVRDVLIDPNDAAVIRTIVALADSMGLGVIAEGVETLGQKEFLARNGCHAYQGYLFGKPLLLEDFERALR